MIESNQNQESTQNPLGADFVQVNGHGIGWAVMQLRNGHWVCRKGWNGKNMWLKLVKGKNMAQRNWQDFVAMYTTSNTYVPWLCSQSDLLANDWEIYEDKEQ